MGDTITQEERVQFYQKGVLDNNEKTKNIFYKKLLIYTKNQLSYILYQWKTLETAIINDLSQEIIIKILTTNKQNRYEQKKANFTTRINKIIRNKFIDYTRKEKWKTIILDNKIKNTLIQNDPSENREENIKKLETLIINREKQKYNEEIPILKLRLIEKLSYKEITKKYNVNINTLKSHFFRKIQTLQSFLKEKGYTS